MARFVSLGGDCQPAEQIKRFSSNSISHFFDWLGCPIKQVGRLIEHDFHNFLTPENLHPFYHNEALYGVIDSLYNIDVNHEILVFNKEYINRVRDTYRIRARWFRELLDPDEDVPYFIRRWTPRDGDENEEDALDLFSLLRSRRSDVKLLYLHNDPDRPEKIMGGYRSMFLRQKTPFLWVGDDDAWNYALHDFAVRGLREHEQKYERRKIPRFA